MVSSALYHLSIGRLPTLSVGVGRIFESVCLFVCLFGCAVHSITKTGTVLVERSKVKVRIMVRVNTNVRSITQKRI